MHLSVIGSSNIVKHHIVSAKKNGFNLVDICTTNKNSKNIKKLYKKYKFKNFFYSYTDMINFHEKNNIDCIYLVAPRIKDTFKISFDLLKKNKIIFVEKPISKNLKEIEKLKLFKKKIYVGYNRLFYRSINYIKKLNLKNTNINIECIEKNKNSFLENSCHVVSILLYIFGEVEIKSKIQRKDYIIVNFQDEKSNDIIFKVLFGVEKNFRIEINNRKFQYQLKPLEKLYTFKKISRFKKNNENFYIENKKNLINEYNNNQLKPGFFLMWKKFKNFLKSERSQVDVQFAYKVIEVSNQIVSK